MLWRLHLIISLVLWLGTGFCQWGALIVHCRKKRCQIRVYIFVSSYHGGLWLRVYLEVTISLMIALYVLLSFQLFMVAPSPDPFRSRGDKTLVAISSSILYYLLWVSFFLFFSFLFFFFKRGKSTSRGKGQRERERILSRLHAQCGAQHRAQFHYLEIMT